MLRSSPPPNTAETHPPQTPSQSDASHEQQLWVQGSATLSVKVACPGDCVCLSPCPLASQTLKEWVAVESVSVQPVPRLTQELLRMMALAAAALRRLGARVDLVDSGSQQVLAAPGSPHLPVHGPLCPALGRGGACPDPG